ncbi:phage major capsid protein [Gottfriedia acidiceleris]|uniref:phage major capsid protein n=1 Tax=Gottfriedia acidiceleris TaxID=371036 RepID=UPI002FFDB594
MNNKSFELRAVDMKLVGNESDELKVSGYVNQTGEWSQTLGSTTRFKERIEKGVFQRAINKAQDIVFLAEHDNNKVLASIESGSLTLREDSKGLYMEAQISPTSWGKDYHTLIKDKLIRGMSFGMKVLKDKWKKISDGTYERTIEDLVLFEISAVRNPAYVQSSIQTRSIELIENPKIEIEIEERNFDEMSLKELYEQKNDVLKQAKSMLDKAKIENRNLEADEQLQQEIFETEIRSINERIFLLEKNQKSSEVNKMEILQNNEVRATDQWLRGQLDGEEIRALSTSVDPGKMTIPTTLSNEIVKKMYEVAPLFSMTRQFTPVNGFLEILREKTLGISGFIGEGQSATTDDFTMDKVRLDQKRVATAMELSQHLINDSGIDVLGYATNLLSRRIGYMLDRNILNGLVATEFEGILPSVGPKDTTIATTGIVTIDDLLDTYNAMNPEYIRGAVWVVSRPIFNLIAKLKDGNGQFYLVRDVSETGVTYKLFDQPIVINDAMPIDLTVGNRIVCFANFSEGYVTMVKKGLELKKVEDSALALKGSQLILLDGYMDGKILNPEAIKFLKTK